MSERERFEAWAAEQEYLMEVMLDGTYYAATTNAAWAAWQAACPEGWQCMPKEATERMQAKVPLTYAPDYVWRAMRSAAPKPEDVE